MNVLMMLVTRGRGPSASLPPEAVPPGGDVICWVLFSAVLSFGLCACESIPGPRSEVGLVLKAQNAVLSPGDSMALHLTLTDGGKTSRWPPEVAYPWGGREAPYFEAIPPGLGDVVPDGVFLAQAPGAGVLRARVGSWTAESSVLVVERPAGWGFRANKVSAGDFHSCALDFLGQVSCWGSNSHGQLGVGEVSRFTASLAPETVPTTVQFVELSAGGRFTCGISTLGEILCWGDNEYGQLGTGSPKEVLPTPTKVSGGPQTPWSTLDTGNSNTCAVTDRGKVWCWGLGYESVPQQMDGPEPMKRISVGGRHVCSIGESGRGYCWGSNEFGQLGNETGLSSSVPTEIVFPGELQGISAGDLHTCVVSDQGEGYCWGNGWHGRLGNGSSAHHSGPTQIELNARIGSISAGGAHTCAVAEDGSGYCWGENRRGQLGVWPNAAFPSVGMYEEWKPRKVASEMDWLQFSAGTEAHTCGLALDGLVFCWGSGDWGQIGSGNYPSVEGWIPSVSPEPVLCARPIQEENGDEDHEN